MTNKDDKAKALKLINKLPGEEVDRIFFKALYDLLCVKELHEKLAYLFSILMISSNPKLSEQEEIEIRELLVRSGKNLKMIVGVFNKSTPDKKVPSQSRKCILLRRKHKKI